MKKIMLMVLLVLAAIVANPTISVQTDQAVPDQSVMTASNDLQIPTITFGPSVAQANMCDQAEAAGWHHPGLNAGCLMWFMMQVDHYGSYVP